MTVGRRWDIVPIAADDGPVAAVRAEKSIASSEACRYRTATRSSGTHVPPASRSPNLPSR